MSIFKRNSGKNIILVSAFVAVLTLAFCHEPAHAGDLEVTLGLGSGVAKSTEMITQRVGVMRDNKWYLRAERFGGEPWNKEWGFFAGRRVQFRQDRNWQPYIQMGVGHFNAPLKHEDKDLPNVTERTTFELGLGISRRLSPSAEMELGFDHNSTAGRSNKNNGIDRIHLTYNWKF
jgi:hypothetical protein